MTTAGLDVSMASAGPQTSVPAKLVGRVPTATSAFPCLDAIMALVLMPFDATVKVGGREPTVIPQFAPTAPTASASVPMNASAATAGLGMTATSAKRWPDVSTEDALITRTPASVTRAGRATSVTELHASWTATTDSAMLRAMVPPTSASASQAGGMRTAASAAHTGDALIKTTTLVSTPMSASASRASQIWMACATTPS